MRPPESGALSTNFPFKNWKIVNLLLTMRKRFISSRVRWEFVFFQIAKGTDAPLYLSFKAFKLMNAEDASSLDNRLQKMMHAFEASTEMKRIIMKVPRLRLIGYA